MSLAPGARLGAYEIVALLGAGGMGEVYRARDTRLKRDVAIKILPDAFANDADRLARFQREAELLATLSHPNIGAVFGLERSEGSSAIVLELIEGDTLADRLTRGAIPVKEALEIALQIAEALEAAHEKGIIHRDLKPANIKCREDGMVKVLDFGLAKALGNDGSSPGRSMSPTMTSPAMMTGGGVILGTAAYMSPEQARGKSADKRSDIWSFGCVLYQMLTAMRAFDGEEVTDTLAAILRADPEWKNLPVDTPPSICKLLRRCLEKDRKNRLHDIGDARLEIKESLGSAPSENTVSAPAAAARSGRRTFVTAALALLLGGLVAGSAVWLATGEPPRAALSPRRFTLTAPSVSPSLVNPARNIAISPDGSTVAYIGGDGRLFLRELGRLDSAAIPDAGPALSPFFSPDGRSLYFISIATRELKKFALPGGPSVTLAALPTSSRGVTWTPDGRVVFATSDATMGLVVVASAGGKPTTLIKPEPKQNESYLWPKAIPGSSALLFTIFRGSLESAQIAVVNVDTKQHKVLVAGSDARFAPTGHLVYLAGNTLFAAPFDLDRLQLTGEPIPVLERVEATTYGAAQFDFSRDGSLIYLPASGANAQRAVVWVDRQGKEEPAVVEPRPYSVPRISPDGTRIAAHLEGVGNVDVFVYDLARKSEMRLTFDTGTDWRSVWSTDGKWIFFRSDMNGPGIYRKASDGSGAVERVVPVLGDGAPNTVSPDLKWILYSNVDSSTGRDIWMVSPDGKGKPQPLIVEPGNQGNPAFSPDGRWIAYQDESQGYIYVRPFPDVSGGRWQVSPENSKWPLWARDGRELFFVSGSVTNRGIMSVAVQAEQNTFKWAAPTVVLNKSYSNFLNNTGPRNYDLSPDGKRFLMIKDGTDDAGRGIVIVENWFEELKRLVPVKTR